MRTMPHQEHLNESTESATRAVDFCDGVAKWAIGAIRSLFQQGRDVETVYGMMEAQYKKGLIEALAWELGVARNAAETVR